jgi:hypothetical protein
MNILPTSPDGTTTPEQMDSYFNDMRRWNFDVAYSAFYAFPLEEVKTRFKKPYEDFVSLAHDRGFPACVQIQSTVGFLDDVALENAQYYADNTTYVYQHFLRYGKKNFFGSFAAPGWLEYIKTIAQTLRSYGYDWVVFEEPMFRVDIPGTKDKLYDRFRETWPELVYPTRQDESIPYLRLQELKSRILEQFYNKLCSFARDIGFQKCGIMPWFFVPTFENTPMETWNTCCHIGKLTFLQDLDFIVVRMQPDNVYAEATIASCGEGMPQISYLENLAQNLGKPILAVNNPTNEHIRLSADTPDNLLPYDYFARFTLAAAAAVPHGMTRHWYRKDYNRDKKHMDLMTQTNRYLTRMGSPASSVALIFSYMGMNRTIPRPWTETWKSFWFLAHRLLYEEKYPALVFFSGTLKESLARHPETKVLVLNEYFPVSPEEVNYLEKWLASDPAHRLLYIGARNGYRSQLDSLYHQFDQKCSEALSLFGCDSDKPVRTVSPGEEVRLNYALKDKNAAFLGKSPVIRCCAYGVPPISPGANVEILYTAARRKDPVIFKKCSPAGGYALFVGLATDGFRNNFPLRQIIDSLLRDDPSPHLPYPMVKCFSPDLLWNRTANNFLFISNCGNRKASYSLKPFGGRVWDVRLQSFLDDQKDISVPPFDFHVLKLVENGQRLLDLEGQIYLTRVEEKPDSVSITGFFNKTLTVFLCEKPATVLLNKNQAKFEWKKQGECHIILIEPPEKGDGEILFRF